MAVKHNSDIKFKIGLDEIKTKDKWLRLVEKYLTCGLRSYISFNRYSGNKNGTYSTFTFNSHNVTNI